MAVPDRRLYPVLVVAETPLVATKEMPQFRFKLYIAGLSVHVGCCLYFSWCGPPVFPLHLPSNCTPTTGQKSYVVVARVIHIVSLLDSRGSRGYKLQVKNCPQSAVASALLCKALLAIGRSSPVPYGQREALMLMTACHCKLRAVQFP